MNKHRSSRKTHYLDDSDEETIEEKILSITYYNHYPTLLERWGDDTKTRVHYDGDLKIEEFVEFEEIEPTEIEETQYEIVYSDGQIQSYRPVYQRRSHSRNFRKLTKQRIKRRLSKVHDIHQRATDLHQRMQTLANQINSIVETTKSFDESLDDNVGDATQHNQETAKVFDDRFEESQSNRDEHETQLLVSSVDTKMTPDDPDSCYDTMDPMTSELQNSLFSHSDNILLESDDELYGESMQSSIISEGQLIDTTESNHQLSAFEDKSTETITSICPTTHTSTDETLHQHSPIIGTNPTVVSEQAEGPSMKFSLNLLNEQMPNVDEQESTWNQRYDQLLDPIQHLEIVANRYDLAMLENQSNSDSIQPSCQSVLVDNSTEKSNPIANIFTEHAKENQSELQLDRGQSNEPSSQEPSNAKPFVTTPLQIIDDDYLWCSNFFMISEAEEKFAQLMIRNSLERAPSPMIVEQVQNNSFVVSNVENQSEPDEMLSSSEKQTVSKKKRPKKKKNKLLDANIETNEQMKTVTQQNKSIEVKNLLEQEKQPIIVSSTENNIETSSNLNVSIEISKPIETKKRENKSKKQKSSIIADDLENKIIETGHVTSSNTIESVPSSPITPIQPQTIVKSLNFLSREPDADEEQEMEDNEGFQVVSYRKRPTPVTSSKRNTPSGSPKFYQKSKIYRRQNQQSKPVVPPLVRKPQADQHHRTITSFSDHQNKFSNVISNSQIHSKQVADISPKSIDPVPEEKFVLPVMTHIFHENQSSAAGQTISTLVSNDQEKSTTIIELPNERQEPSNSIESIVINTPTSTNLTSRTGTKKKKRKNRLKIEVPTTDQSEPQVSSTVRVDVVNHDLATTLDTKTQTSCMHSETNSKLDLFLPNYLRRQNDSNEFQTSGDNMASKNRGQTSTRHDHNVNCLLPDDGIGNDKKPLITSSTNTSQSRGFQVWFQNSHALQTTSPTTQPCRTQAIQKLVIQLADNSDEIEDWIRDEKQIHPHYGYLVKRTTGTLIDYQNLRKLSESDSNSDGKKQSDRKRSSANKPNSSESNLSDSTSTSSQSQSQSSQNRKQKGLRSVHFDNWAQFYDDYIPNKTNNFDRQKPPICSYARPLDDETFISDITPIERQRRYGDFLQTELDSNTWDSCFQHRYHQFRPSLHFRQRSKQSAMNDDSDEFVVFQSNDGLTKIIAAAL